MRRKDLGSGTDGSPQGHSISLWIAGLPENADRHNLRVYLAGRRLDITYIGTRNDGEPRQVNAEVRHDAAPGAPQIRVDVGDSRIAPADLLII